MEIGADADLNSRLGVVSAPTARRMLAFVLDTVVLAAVSSPAWFGADALGELVTSPGSSGAALWDAVIPLSIGFGLGFVLLTVQMIVAGVRGVTIGKAAFGLRAVAVETLLRPGIANMMLRGVIVWLPGMVVPVLGAVPFLASGLADPSRRGRSWHDRASGVWLVDTRGGLDPIDREALRAARRELTRPAVGELRPLPTLASGRAPLDPALVNIARSTAGVISALASDNLDWQPEAHPAAAAASGGSGRTAAPTPGAFTSAHTTAGAPGHATPGPATAGSATPGPTTHGSATHGSATPDPATPGSETSGTTAPSPDVPDVEMSTWDLVLDDGTRRRLPVRSLIGRAPTMPPGADDYALIVVTDPAMEMSRTHLAVTVEAGRVWIADLDTPNGTDVLLRSGERMTLGPREPVPVEPGSRVSIGDRTFAFEEIAQ